MELLKGLELELELELVRCLYIDCIAGEGGG